MTPKQLRFVEEYSLDHNGAGAAVRAGFAPNSARVTASRLLAKANVAEAVAVRESEAAKSMNMTRARVLEALQDAFDKARQASDPKAMVAAAREIAKVCGFYAPERRKVEVTSAGARAMMARLEAMSDEELLAVIGASG